LTSSTPSLGTQFFNLGPVRRLERWLNAVPHPSLVIEISSTHVAAAQWSKVGGHLEAHAVEPLPIGAVMASPVDANVIQPEAVRSALRKVLSRVPARGAPLTLLIPDPVVRVFILPFETLPRRADEALPLLRWRLKKSVPFDVDETVVSWMRQTGKEDALEVVTAVARQRIVREYEEILEPLNAKPKVVLSSTLATLPLIPDTGSTLLVRMSGKTITTVIVREGNLSIYRSTEMASDPAALDVQAMLDEIFPAVAFYQDTWGASPDKVRITGFGAREEIFRRALANELKCPVGLLADSENALLLESSAKDLMQHDLDALVGWMLNEG
jgi:type IV pilus assembly protein PilM